MSRRVVVLAEAEEDIRQASRWYEEQRPGLGIELLGAVEAAIGLAAATPERWPIWTGDQRFRRVVLRRFPYLLVYELRADGVEVVAVAHARREPGYWISRPRSHSPSKDDR